MNKLIVSTSPHLRRKRDTSAIMGDVLIALVPAAAAACIFFGFKALVMIAVCVGCAVASEFIFNLICKKKQTVGDLSAIVTGLLLALSLPATANIWHCIVGSVFAIIVVKCLFGGIGHNFANPAITARVLLLVAFGDALTLSAVPNFAEITSGATPLALIKSGFLSATPIRDAISAIIGGEADFSILGEVLSECGESLLPMFLGNVGGAIGETSALALIIGGIYLLVRRVIKWHTPVIYIGTVFVLSLIFKLDPYYALYQVLGGGLIMGAFFMATDYSTSPINDRGKMVFALGCGIITFLIRVFGSYPEGVSFAILLMNILAPYIERITAKKPFGVGGKKHAKK